MGDEGRGMERLGGKGRDWEMMEKLGDDGRSSERQGVADRCSVIDER